MTRFQASTTTANTVVLTTVRENVAKFECVTAGSVPEYDLMSCDRQTTLRDSDGGGGSVLKGSIYLRGLLSSPIACYIIIILLLDERAVLGVVRKSNNDLIFPPLFGSLDGIFRVNVVGRVRIGLLFLRHDIVCG